MEKDRATLSMGQWIRRVLVTLAIVVTALVAWQLSGVLLMAFGGTLLAVVLSAAAEFVSRHTPLSRQVAFWIIVVLVLGILVGAGWLLAGQVAGQVEEFGRRFPQLIRSVEQSLKNSPLIRVFPGLSDITQGADGGGQGLKELGTATMNTVSALGNAVVLVAVGIFLGMDPGTYRKGLLTLVPERARPAVGKALSATATAMSHWFLGKLVAMVFVGVATGLGLWALGVPLALTLGIVAGLIDFIPYLGPFIAAAPALIVALSSGGFEQVLFVGALYLVVQQVEGNMLEPFIQRRAVEVQPAVLILGVVGAGVIFGFAGVILGAPLLVAIQTMVQKLYIEEGLEGER